MIIVLGGQISGFQNKRGLQWTNLLFSFEWIRLFAFFFLELDENITTLGLSGRYEATTSYLLAE